MHQNFIARQIKGETFVEISNHTRPIQIEFKLRKQMLTAEKVYVLKAYGSIYEQEFQGLYVSENSGLSFSKTNQKVVIFSIVHRFGTIWH